MQKYVLLLQRQITTTGIELWCNGNTTDSGPVIPGSNPGSSTKRLRLRGRFFLRRTPCNRGVVQGGGCKGRWDGFESSWLFMVWQGASRNSRDQQSRQLSDNHACYRLKQGRSLVAFGLLGWTAADSHVVIPNAQRRDLPLLSAHRTLPSKTRGVIFRPLPSLAPERRCYLTALTTASNAFGSFMARSASTLRFRAMPFWLSLPINCE